MQARIATYAPNKRSKSVSEVRANKSVATSIHQSKRVFRKRRTIGSEERANGGKSRTFNSSNQVYSSEVKTIIAKLAKTMEHSYSHVQAARRGIGNSSKVDAS